MADTETKAAANGENGQNGKNGENWEYADEEANDYAWEYETESEDDVVDKEVARRNSQDEEIKEKKNKVAPVVAKKKEAEEEEESEEEEEEEEEEDEEIPLDEQDLPDPFSAAPIEATTKKEKESNGERRKHKHKKHKKSRHQEKIEAFNKKEAGGASGGGGGVSRSKRIHVRSKDPMRIARQLEKSLKNGHSSSKQQRSSKRRGPAPPEIKVNTICKICGKEPYVVERVVAEKSWWHKNCFRCKQCNKSVSLDTYMSHEGVIYCKPHQRELFQPKAVLHPADQMVQNANKGKRSKSQREQELSMEAIVKESTPVDLGDDVVKSSNGDEKYTGLEDLDVGSKFKMFEKKGRGKMEEPERSGPSSDRYGIMEKLQRLQDGEDLDDLLAEIDEELPDAEENPEEMGMSEVQKKMARAERSMGDIGQERRGKMADDRRRQKTGLREKIMTGTTDVAVDKFGDVLNSSANRIKKTKIDVRSENAKKFRDLFDKGEVPDSSSMVTTDRITADKQHELENMRKHKREQKDFFKKLETGELFTDASEDKKEPKLLIGKISKDENGEYLNQDMPEMATLSNRFSFFENFETKEQEKKKKKTGGFRMTPPREGADGDEEGGAAPSEWKSLLTETDVARKECKARSVLNKFKEMETRVLNGEDEVKPADDPDKPIISALGFLGKLPGVGERRPNMKRFTPPRKLGSDESGSDYSDSEYSDSDSYTDSYTGSCYSDSDSEEEQDETLRAMRATARAKSLRAKFEEWEQSKDAKDQSRQMELMDENGASIETASILKNKFEALKMNEDEEDDGEGGARPKFRPRRFK